MEIAETEYILVDSDRNAQTKPQEFRHILFVFITHDHKKQHKTYI